MTTPPQPPRWPGDDRPMYNPAPDDTYRPPPSGYGQGREQVQSYYGSYQPPPPTPPLPAVYGQGQPQPYYQVAPKNPALGLIASLFIPGLGSMISGKAGKGVLILCCSIVAWLTAVVVVGFILGPAVWIWGMVAGYQDAQNWNRDHGIIS